MRVLCSTFKVVIIFLQKGRLTAFVLIIWDLIESKLISVLVLCFCHVVGNEYMHAAKQNILVQNRFLQLALTGIDNCSDCIGIERLPRDTEMAKASVLKISKEKRGSLADKNVVFR